MVLICHKVANKMISILNYNTKLFYFIFVLDLTTFILTQPRNVLNKSEEAFEVTDPTELIEDILTKFQKILSGRFCFLFFVMTILILFFDEYENLKEVET